MLSAFAYFMLSKKENSENSSTLPFCCNSLAIYSLISIGLIPSNICNEREKK